MIKLFILKDSIPLVLTWKNIQHLLLCVYIYIHICIYIYIYCIYIDTHTHIYVHIYIHTSTIIKSTLFQAAACIFLRSKYSTFRRNSIRNLQIYFRKVENTFNKIGSFFFFCIILTKCPIYS